MIWFQLWREFKLSIAEILFTFPEGKIVYLDKNFLILENTQKDEVLQKCDTLWWTIKVLEVDNNSTLKEFILSKALKNISKFVYWVSVFWNKSNLKDLLVSSKKFLKQNNISARFINKNFENLNSSQVFLEWLVDKSSDFTVLNSRDTVYIWTTIWVQNINKYSERDYEKLRDMQTGMLPPKLAQIMINISWFSKVVYDPFVWLGTVLIEAVLQWYKWVYGSDINEKMIDSSISNLKKLKSDWSSFLFKVFNFDSRDLWDLGSKDLDLVKLMEAWDINIVTEGFLWEIMTKKNICENRINIQKKNLIKLYKKFFSGLKKINFSWNIVISFPFWELDWKYIYFSEIYDIINRYCFIHKLLPDDLSFNETKAWSLLYKRNNQLVWREIFKLKMKK